jgi:hypothetical protein
VPVEAHVLIANVGQEIVLAEGDLLIAVAVMDLSVKLVGAVLAPVVFAAVRRRQMFFPTQARRAPAQRNPRLLRQTLR